MLSKVLREVQGVDVVQQVVRFHHVLEAILVEATNTTGLAGLAVLAGHYDSLVVGS